MRPVCSAAAFLCTCPFLVAASGPADAHASLVDSYPSAKQHLTAPPSVIKLRFSGRADAHYSTVSIVSEDGSVVASRTQPSASREFDLPAPQLRPGRYRVHYRVLSTDGDLVEGKIEFAVGD